jgi:hypothetical protein
MEDSRKGKRIKRDFASICPTCGNRGTSFHMVRDDTSYAPIGLGRCAKCSNDTYPLTIEGLFWLVDKLVKDNMKLKSDMFDVQCYIEEQVDPVGGEQ